MKSAAILLTGVTLIAAMPGSAGGEEKPKKALAIVNGREVTEEDIRQKAQPLMLRLEAQMYQTRKRALDAVVSDYLIEDQAKKEGMTTEELLRREVESKIGAITDAEVQQFYEARRAQINKPLDEVRKQIVEAIKNNRAAMLRAEYVTKIREKSQVRVFLGPPVVALAINTKKAFARGNPEAPVTIVEFADYRCGFCAKVEPELGRLQEIYKDKIQIVLKNFPLSDAGETAAQAARCAGEQGRYWEYHSLLFQNQRTLDAGSLKKFAGDLHLDAARFSGCLGEGRYTAAVKSDRAEGERAGVSATPTFFINGRLLQGAQPLSAFREVIDDLIEAR